MAAAAAVGYYDLCRGCPIERNGAKLDHRHDDESADDAVKLGNHAWERGGGRGLVYYLRAAHGSVAEAFTAGRVSKYLLRSDAR